MKFSKTRFAVVLSISIVAILSLQAFAFSDVLDTYAGTGFSDYGAESVDSFVISDGNFYTETEITASDRWPNTYAGMTLIPRKKGTFGYSNVTSKANSFTAYDTTGIVEQSFTGLSNGTYKIWFKSQFQENGLDFEGTVYDTDD